MSRVLKNDHAASPVADRSLAALLTATLFAGAAAAAGLPAFRAAVWKFNRAMEAFATTGKPQTIQTARCTYGPTECK
jgi:hypothetical protein